MKFMCAMLLGVAVGCCLATSNKTSCYVKKMMKNMNM